MSCGVPRPKLPCSLGSRVRLVKLPTDERAPAARRSIPSEFQPEYRADPSRPGRS